MRGKTAEEAVENRQREIRDEEREG